jgi:predicted phosphodiesterase
MSILVVSDTHLTDRFEPKKYAKLRDLIDKSDRVVLNGDFWDGYQIEFDRFYHSQWKSLFPLLKSKKTIYIFGNHDKKEFSDKRIYDFCDTACDKSSIDYGGKKFFFEHGDARVWKVDRSLGINRPNHLLNAVTEFIQEMAIKILGLWAFVAVFGKMNEVIKKVSVQKCEGKRDCVCFFGHIHVAEIDLDNNFVNTGIFNYGYAQYATIHSNGDVVHHNERY